MRNSGKNRRLCGPFNSASIDSPHEHAFVLSLLSPSKNDIWIGVGRTMYDAFKWINGNPLRCLFDCNRAIVTSKLSTCMLHAFAGTSGGLQENRRLIITGALRWTRAMATGKQQIAIDISMCCAKSLSVRFRALPS